MQQEAILTAKTYMGTILSYPWDRDSMITTDIYGNKKAIVLSTGSLVFENPGESLRKGHVDQTHRRVMMQNATTGNLIEADPTMPKSAIDRSINNYDGEEEDLIVATADIDSVVHIKLRSDVRYVTDVGGADYTNSTIIFNFNDGGVAAGTNIKLVTVTADLPDYPNALQIRLRAYTSNIGELELWSN
jgi:hypothetical protein